MIDSISVVVTNALRTCCDSTNALGVTSHTKKNTFKLTLHFSTFADLARVAMPKTIIFEVGVLRTDGQIQFERVRAPLETWPEICEEVEWPGIRKKLQEFCRKREWPFKVKYQNLQNDEDMLEDLHDPSSLRKLFELHGKAMLGVSVKLPVFLFADPTNGTSSFGKEAKDIVLEVKEQDSLVLLKLQSDCLLGKGGFGNVWRARDRETEIEYAVKISLPGAGSQKSMEMEIEALKQLNHPNIMKILKHGYADPTNDRLPAYMMYLGRCSVANLLETGWHNKEAAEAADRDISSALEHFHAAGLVHMDVTPGNWLVTSKSIATSGETQLELSLIDAGLVGRLNKDLVTKVCTRQYAHPLQTIGIRGISFPHPRDKFVCPFYDRYGMQKAILQLNSSDSDKATLSDKQLLQRASRTLARNKELVLEAVQQDGMALHFAHEEVRSDKEVVTKAVEKNGFVLKFASETSRGDKEIVMQAVRQNGRALQFASGTLRGDKDVVMAAVRQNSMALEFASGTLLGEKELVMEAIQQNGRALTYVSKELRGEKEIVKVAIRTDGNLLSLASEALRSDKEVVVEAVRKNGHALQFASQTLRGDKEVVMEAVQQNGTALKYASKTLQVEKDVVTVAVRQKNTSCDTPS